MLAIKPKGFDDFVTFITISIWKSLTKQLKVFGNKIIYFIVQLYCYYIKLSSNTN